MAGSFGSRMSQEDRDVFLAAQVSRHKAEELCGQSDAHAELLILLDQLSAWKLHSEDSQVAHVNRDSVKMDATNHAKDNGRYDMVQFLNALAAKAVKKNWNIRTLVLELKDEDVIVNPDR